MEDEEEAEMAHETLALFEENKSEVKKILTKEKEKKASIWNNEIYQAILNKCSAEGSWSMTSGLVGLIGAEK